MAGKAHKLKIAVAEMACWSAGAHRPWQSDCILGSDQLRALTELAAYAPAGLINAFLRDYVYGPSDD